MDNLSGIARLYLDLKRKKKFFLSRIAKPKISIIGIPMWLVLIINGRKFLGKVI